MRLGAAGSPETLFVETNESRAQQHGTGRPAPTEDGTRFVMSIVLGSIVLVQIHPGE